MKEYWRAFLTILQIFTLLLLIFTGYKNYHYNNVLNEQNQLLREQNEQLLRINLKLIEVNNQMICED